MGALGGAQERRAPQTAAAAPAAAPAPAPAAAAAACRSIGRGSARLAVLSALLQAVVLIRVTTQATAQITEGIEALQDLISTDPQLLCLYVTCQEPVLASDCPEGTLYMEGVAQFGCCGACVRFREKGEPCTGAIDDKSVGDVPIMVGISSAREDNVVESSWCNHTYFCTSQHKCQPNSQDKGCLLTQQKYDDAINSDAYLPYRDDYRWRPDCTPQNEYEAKQCKGPRGEQDKRCVCVDPEGNRIYGEAFPEQKQLYNSMNCKCSRRVWELQQAGKTTITLHCLENGNYEPLQCEDGWCYCIDPVTANPYGNNLPEAAKHFLHCYNSTVTGEQYLRRCESEYVAYVKLSEHMALKGVRGPYKLLVCDPDGSYSARQCDISSCKCYDKYMDQPALTGSNSPGCQCARHTQLYQDAGVIVQLQCQLNNGNYTVHQKQGNSGLQQAGTVFCVDDDGVRAGPLVYETWEENLLCNTAASCQTNGVGCESACSNCDTTAYANYVE